VSDATCKTCPWCKLQPEYSPAYLEAGWCCKNAPVVEQDPAYFGQAAWPLILYTDVNWCGEHPERAATVKA